MDLELHPIVQLFPEMNDDEYSYLRDDIKEHGQMEPITVLAGTNQVLDGRHRLRACRELGIEPKTREVARADEYEILCYVRSANAARRHMDASQRAAVAADLEALLQDAARKRQLAGLKQFSGTNTDVAKCHDGSGRSRDLAAAAMQVSPRYVSEAKRVKEADQGVFDRVKKGKIELQDGLMLIKAPDEMRSIAVGMIDAGTVQPRAALAAARREFMQEREHELPPDPENCRLLVCDVASLTEQIAPESVDVIITDPPYPDEYLHCYEDLAKLAAVVLRPGGSLLAMSGRLRLQEQLNLMVPHIEFVWLLAYMLPGSNVKMWNINILTGWKPVLWFRKGGINRRDDQPVRDVITSVKQDKQYHTWGQSETGISALITQFSEPGDLVLDPFLGGGTTAVCSLA